MSLCNALQDLLKEYPLSSVWGNVELFEETNSIGDHSEIQLIGLFVRRQKLFISGSAGHQKELSDPFLLKRAYFELMERVSILEAEESIQDFFVRDKTGRKLEEITCNELFPLSSQPKKWRYAKSNGVAAHVDRLKAYQSALLELVERHVVLHYWYHQESPEILNNIRTNEIVEQFFGKITEYKTQLYLFPVESDPNTYVTAVFATPQRSSLPFVFGFAARHSLIESVKHACTECIQRLGFLYGEPLPGWLLKFSPTPGYHQEYFLRKKGIRQIHHWLSQGTSRKTPLTLPTLVDTRYVEITPTRWKDKAHVVKAIHPELLSLTFGKNLCFLPEKTTKKLAIHPIA